MGELKIDSWDSVRQIGIQQADENGWDNLMILCWVDFTIWAETNGIGYEPDEYAEWWACYQAGISSCIKHSY